MADRKPRASSSAVNAATPRMKEMYDSGSTLREIAEELDLSRETVRLALVAAGVEPKQPRSRKPLSDAEVQRLRLLVGFDPDKPEGR